ADALRDRARHRARRRHATRADHLAAHARHAILLEVLLRNALVAEVAEVDLHEGILRARRRVSARSRRRLSARSRLSQAARRLRPWRARCPPVTRAPVRAVQTEDRARAWARSRPPGS